MYLYNEEPEVRKQNRHEKSVHSRQFSSYYKDKDTAFQTGPHPCIYFLKQRLTSVIR